MKRLIWKLRIENKTMHMKRYSVEERTWFVVLFLIVTLPIAVILLVFHRLYLLYWHPFNITHKVLESSYSDKEHRKAFFNELIKQ